MAELDSLCPNCSAPLPPRFAVCPQCGARKIVAHGYEWKSKGTWMGEPLIHIAFGCEPTGRPRTARGMIAIGQRAIGGIAIGVVAAGWKVGGVAAIGEKVLFSVKH